MVHVMALAIGSVLVLTLLAFVTLVFAFPFLFWGFWFVGIAYFFGRLVLSILHDRARRRGVWKRP